MVSIFVGKTRCLIVIQIQLNSRKHYIYALKYAKRMETYDSVKFVKTLIINFKVRKS